MTLKLIDQKDEFDLIIEMPFVGSLYMSCNVRMISVLCKKPVYLNVRVQFLRSASLFLGGVFKLSQTQSEFMCRRN